MTRARADGARMANEEELLTALADAQFRVANVLYAIEQRGDQFTREDLMEMLREIENELSNVLHRHGRRPVT